jgi:cytochrome c556
MDQIIMRLIGFTLAAFCVTATALVATPALEKATEARHAQMQMVSYHTGVLGDMAKGETPYDAAIATAAAENLASVASMSKITMWIEGSEQGAIEGSRAKSEIWSDAAGFEASMTALVTAATAMIPAAGTDLDALRAAMGPIGNTCGDCHKAYRGPRN